MRVWLEWIAPVFLLTTALFFLWRDTTPRAAEGLHRITAAQWLHEGAPEPKPVRLPHSLDDERPEHRQWATYFLDWPDTLLYSGSADDPPRLGLLLPRVASQYRVLLNGAEIGQYGWRTEPGSRVLLASSMPHLLAIPPWLLTSDPRHNRIAVEIAGIELDRAGLSDAILGEYDALQQRFFRLMFWQNTMTGASALIGFVVAFVGLSVWLHLRHNAYLLTALCALFFGARSTMLMHTSIDIPYALFFFADRLFFIALSVLLMLTIERFLRDEQRPHRAFDATVLAAWGSGALALTFLSLSVLSGEYLYTKLMAATLSATSLVCLSAIGFVSIARRSLVSEKRLVFIGACFMLITGLRDFAVIQFGAPGDGDIRWMVAGSMTLLIIFGIVLGQQTAEASRQLRELSHSLSDQLSAKTRHLQMAMAERQRHEIEEHRLKDRQRIMRDLHDGLGSQLSTAIAVLQKTVPETTPGRDAALRQVQAAMQNLRLTLDSMEPHEGDLPTILGMVRRRMLDLLDTSGIEVKWRMQAVPPLPHLEGRAALDLIHLVQEAITNVLKHAQARTLLVQVWQESDAGGERVCLLLQDDGVGLAGSRQANPQGGLGLNNMRQRAERIGASLTFLDACPGLGIRLCFVLHERPPHSSLMGLEQAGIDIDFDLIEQASNR